MLTENRWKNSSPQVKVKYRSIVPTVFSLLASVVEDEALTMISERETTDTPSVEMKSQETKEIPEMNESVQIPNSNNGAFNFLKDDYSSRGSTRVTEDIYMRENEDGVLSHFCPLDKDRDGVRDENEDYPHNPMNTDCMDWIKKGCSLSSDEIPCLMAEPPAKSDDSTPDNSVSNIDSSTSMIYPLVQNLPAMKEEDKVSQRLLQERKQMPSFRKLEEEILKDWSEEYSDENDFYVSKQNDEEKPKKHVVGDESDMEEFEANETEIENEDFKSGNDEVNHKGNFEKESFRNEPEDEAEKSSTSEHSTENSEDVSIKDSEQRASNFKTSDEDKDSLASRKETGNKPDNCDEENNSLQSADDRIQIEFLKAEVQSAILKATASLNPSTLKCHDTTLNGLTKIREEEIDQEVSKNATSVNDTNEKKSCKVNCKFYAEELRPERDRKEEKREQKMPNEDASSEAAEIKIESKDSRTESEINATSTQSKGGKQENLSMEPGAMNLPKTEEDQPDLRTALRFMTEVYHSKDEDELYFDTLSDMDLPMAKEMPEAVIKDAEEKPNDMLVVDYKSPNKSSNFETVLTEEKRPVTRHRNKLARLISAFRKKLGKKA